MYVENGLLEPMREQDVDEAAALVARAMNPDEGRWAARTMLFHFGCKAHGLDDGRSYLVWTSARREPLGRTTSSVEPRQGGAIAGLVGLHHTIWGPEENVWLAWFAVDPVCQGQGLGRRLLAAIEEVAARLGYRKLLVETYEHEDFAKARRFYERNGFQQAGRIGGYLRDGSAMLVYAKSIGQSE
jgi:GNAT superfamily N-acetyltransferase